MTCLALNAQTIQGKVVRVSDGDTITILDEGKVENKIRLNRIDRPEKGTVFGVTEMMLLHHSYSINVVSPSAPSCQKVGNSRINGVSSIPLCDMKHFTIANGNDMCVQTDNGHYLGLNYKVVQVDKGYP